MEAGKPPMPERPVVPSLTGEPKPWQPQGAGARPGVPRRPLPPLYEPYPDEFITTSREEAPRPQTPEQTSLEAVYEVLDAFRAEDPTGRTTAIYFVPNQFGPETTVIQGRLRQAGIEFPPEQVAAVAAEFTEWVQRGENKSRFPQWQQIAKPAQTLSVGEEAGQASGEAEARRRRVLRTQVTELARRNPEAIQRVLRDLMIEEADREEGTQRTKRRPTVPTLLTIQEEADARARQALEPIIRQDLREEFDQERERLIQETEERVRQELAGELAADEEKRRTRAEELRQEQRERSLPNRIRRDVSSLPSRLKRPQPESVPPPAEAAAPPAPDETSPPSAQIPTTPAAATASPEPLAATTTGGQRRGLQDRIPFLRGRPRQTPEPTSPPAAPHEAAPSADDLLASFNELSRDLGVSTEDLGHSFLPPEADQTPTRRVTPPPPPIEEPF